MKKYLLFNTNFSMLIVSMLTTVLVSNVGWSQTNLVLNGGADAHTASTSDNADAWDMTPNSTIKDETNADVSSPYKALWHNSDLESYLESTYVTSGSGVEEQPGSSSDGTYNTSGTKTRSVKLYFDPAKGRTVSASTRRLYQKIAVTAGTSYTFSIDSRSEAENVPSEVFMLNEDITTEVGLENGAADSRVDHYLEITNDHNTSKGSAGNNTFTTSTFTFTASKSTVVIYVRALAAISGSTEVFYDNISLVEATTASTTDLGLQGVQLYPNPASSMLHITAPVAIDNVQVYNVLGKEVAGAASNQVDVSGLTNGVYIVKMTSGEASISKSFIKE